MIDSITNGYVYCQGIPEQWQTLAVYTTLTLLIDKPLTDWYTGPLADSLLISVSSEAVYTMSPLVTYSQQEVATA